MREITQQDCARVLRAIGVEPDRRIDPGMQDPEFQIPTVEELPAYWSLYTASVSTSMDKRVLFSFMLECLNSEVLAGRHHALERKILTEVLHNRSLHQDQIGYWSGRSDQDPDHWWPIACVLQSKMAGDS